MTDNATDSLFKLRLTGQLRQRLEAEAAKRGLTLTGEILRRIDETFSDVSDRLTELEKAESARNTLFERMNDRLWHIERGLESALRQGELRVFRYRESGSDVILTRTDIVGRMLVVVKDGQIIAGEYLRLEDIQGQKVALQHSFPYAHDVIIVHSDGSGNFYELPWATREHR
ncbi:hypothetical protein [Asaia bogorensis]|uniref:Uncharacterized protein n=1 Tax=Asaia bogorensis NBRC 16594 TaxID=1231624 RepID=A0AAN4U336_9PROT|nr:hypothetical protein [Asaia bogorensis]BAT19828.1 hypothetical protein Asbog_01555 [Asaia bogorensis NBRC 16594]GBQ77564.1 hypothetical protein AA0311_1478 [Asaia bogorensis NBRC 16594]GEL54329.1 hypothetical protein ABO01nite_23360 [Asaia bogorensis NBRC 16594]